MKSRTVLGLFCVSAAAAGGFGCNTTTCVDEHNCMESASGAESDGRAAEGSAGSGVGGRGGHTGAVNAAGSESEGGEAGTLTADGALGSPGTDAGDGGPGDAAGEGVDGGGECVTCGADCVEVETDTLHCGQCDHACATEGVSERRCVDGKCRPACIATRIDCGTPEAPAADDGCEADPAVDLANCGACGRACSTAGASGTSCVAGACTPNCAAGRLDCATPPAPALDNGCEVDMMSDAQNCGACGRACSISGASGVTCVLGECVPLCSAGRADCSTPRAPAADDGCEVAIGTDPDNCGACDFACSSEGATSRACSSGACTPTCGANRGDCSTPATSDDGCETSTTFDEQNCGACSHDCVGGPCNASQCSAVTLMSGLRLATLGLAGSYVYAAEYVGTGARVLRKHVDSTGTPTIISNSQRWAANPVSDGASVYWVGAGASDAGPSHVFSAPADGSGSPATFSANGTTLGPITRVGTTVYWADTASGAVWVQSTTGGSAALFATGLAAATDMVTDGSVVIWSTPSGFSVAANQVPPPSGGNPAASEPLAGGIDAVDLDATDLYYTTGAEVRRRPRLTGATVTLAVGSNPGALAIDATHAYWCDGSSIRRAPKDGSVPASVVIASIKDPTGAYTLSCSGIAIDGSAIYFSTASFNDIVGKIAKPLP